MSDKVSIKGLCKITLLREMWKNQKVAAFFGGGSGPAFNYQEASLVVHGYIDYFCGRAMKVDLSGDYVNPYAYNRDSNKKLEDIVASLY
jgi:hypothetical protein